MSSCCEVCDRNPTCGVDCGSCSGTEVTIVATWRHHDIAGAYALDIDSKAYPHARTVCGAHVTIEFRSVDRDQRLAAAAAAWDLRDRILALGALSVHVVEGT